MPPLAKALTLTDAVWTMDAFALWPCICDRAACRTRTRSWVWMAWSRQGNWDATPCNCEYLNGLSVI